MCVIREGIYFVETSDPRRQEIVPLNLFIPIKQIPIRIDPTSSSRILNASLTFERPSAKRTVGNVIGNDIPTKSAVSSK